MRDLDAVSLIRRVVSRPAIALLAAAPCAALAAGGTAPAVPGVPPDFALFALTLPGVALFPRSGDPPAAPTSTAVR